MRFLEHIELNPKISLEKGELYPFVEMANVSTVNREPDDIGYKKFNSGVRFEDNDTVIARIEPCLQNGKKFFVKEIGKGFGSTEYLVFRPKDESVDPIFLYYFMQTEFIRKSMINSMSGSTGRQRVNNDIFNTLEISLPAVKSQKRIASILSAYDDLIETNRKQIKLLEEAAQRLYKEWFVDFRFPGHENVKIVDGVPEGWALLPLSEIFDYIRGKSYTSVELSNDEGVLMVNLKNIKAFGSYNRNSEKRFTGKFKENQILQPGDVVMGVTDMTKERRIVGHVAMVPDLGETMIFSMDLIKLVPKMISNTFLYSTMHFGEFSKKIAPLANGTNVLHLKPDAMRSLKMLVPKENVLSVYDKIIEPILKKVDLLQLQCERTAEARDRLLPKLMSGEIEVEQELQQPKFNNETEEAIQEARDIMSGKIEAKSYSSVDEMLKDN